MNQRFLLLGLVATVALLSSCVIFPEPEFQSTYVEHFTRFDTQRETFEWILIEHGITKLKKDADEQFEAVLAGKRVYPAGGGFPSFDVDQLTSGEIEVRDNEGRKAVLGFLADVRVLEARLVLDANGAPSLWRRIVVEHVSQFDGIWNLATMLPEFDVATIELMRKAKERGHKPWSFQGTALVFDAPVSAEYADLCHQAWTSLDPETWQSGPPVQSFDGTNLRLWFTPRDSWDVDAGWVQSFIIPGKTAKSESEIRSHLQQRGFTIESEAELRQQFEKRGIIVEPQETYAQLRTSAGLP